MAFTSVEGADPPHLAMRTPEVEDMLPKARQERQRSLEKVMEMLDRAISQAEDERRAGTLGDLLKDTRRELARFLEDEPGAEPYIRGREILG